MSDKREPEYVILLRKQGKKNNKIEMFKASLWTDYYTKNNNCGIDRFRLRVNGKWWPKGEARFITKTQVKELVFKKIR